MMTNEEALRILKEYQLWRRGLPPYENPASMPYTPKELGQALDHATAVLERPADHSGDSTNMVTPFDGRVAEIFSYTLWLGDYQRKVRRIITDMQAHIRKQNALLLEAADEIEAYVNNQYSEGARDKYPTIRYRYNRDMDIVNRIRKEARAEEAVK